MSTGTGRIFKRESVWWIDFSFRGQRHRESSGSSRKKDAQQLLRNRMMEMGRGRLVGPDAEAGRDYDVDNLVFVWDVTTQQDKTIIENNQAGILSTRYEPGPYSEHEAGTAKFIHWYLRQHTESQQLA